MEKLDNWLVKYKSLIFIGILLGFILMYVFIQYRPAFIKVKSTPEEIAELKMIVINGFDMMNIRLTEAKITQDSINKENKILMQRIPVIFPSPTARITSNYGMRDSIMHWGVDIAQQKGSPIYSPLSGKVIQAKYEDGYGNLTIIDSGIFLVKIAHQDKILVALNQNIAQGELIGTVGDTGNSKGAHEHIEIEQNGKHRDPKLFIR